MPACSRMCQSFILIKEKERTFAALCCLCDRLRLDSNEKTAAQNRKVFSFSMRELLPTAYGCTFCFIRLYDNCLKNGFFNQAFCLSVFLSEVPFRFILQELKGRKRELHWTDKSTLSKPKKATIVPHWLSLLLPVLTN